MISIFDSHTHINSHEFDEDIPDVIERARAMNVDGMLVLGYDRESADKMVELVNNYDNIYGAIGIHPEDAAKYEELEEQLRVYLIEPKVKAVGEIGLDYHCDVDHDLQKEVFRKQIELAHEFQLPISVHNRDAFEDTYEILKETNGAQYGGIMHSFNGDVQWAQQFIELGMDLSFSGVVTYDNAPEVQEAAKYVPLEHLLVETDAPYLTPMPYRNRQNEPGMTRYTVEFLAKLRNENIDNLANQTMQNAKRILKIQ
ncbi:MAG TPA: TatD family hydrolase [Candidatus Ligilactobacillus excrementigallinarum]|uniref:TatD family hydrolase n=1 Tax=Candidatus Ligilactobacillus excrementigallinarum TaxID=2838641 RepID=A0A9D1UXN1_9LACO|nr:TatD family hydrolase [Candidatus Ligilactobacillus excrementigallinarum]